MTVDGSEVLFSTTRFDGVLRSWAIENGTPMLIDTVDFDSSVLPGGVSTLVTLNVDGNMGFPNGAE